MMTLRVAQKHMNLQKSIALACCAIVLTSCDNKLSELASESKPANSSRQTFAQLCRQKASLSPEAKNTVEVLLKTAGATDCDVANQKLSSMTKLDLKKSKITDVKPLQSLTQLTTLNLGGNKISDLKPLESLTNLTWLYLGFNQVSDITPLPSLTKLKWLYLNNNQISDIKPLESATKLTELYLSDNPIAPKTCPLKPESICKWEPPTKP
jgi:Leucine-rich repeat (LRR) protein